MKKLYLLFLTAIFFTSLFPQVSYGYYSQMPEYLCELGIKFFQQGRYDEALHEFRKALIAQPGYEPALKYIEMTEHMIFGPQMEAEEVIIPAAKPSAVTAGKTVEEYLDLIELQREMIKEKQKPLAGVAAPGVLPEKIVLPSMPYVAKPREFIPKPVEIAKKIYPPKELTLDETLSQIKQPIEIEQGETITIKGVNIQRFLVTQPDVLTVERMSPNEISVTGKNLGYTYVHIWDNNGRWTVEFLTIPPRPIGPTIEEEMRREEETARNFKLRYNLDWSSFGTGRRLNSLKYNPSSWRQSFNLFGEIPYGMFDSTVSLITFERSTDVTYMTAGLTQGKIGNFKDFNLRLLDYNPHISSLILSGANLRGAMFNSPAFDKKLDYTLFWGREGGGYYGGFTPGFTTTLESYLSGIDVNIKPWEKQKYGFSAVRGWGKERFPDLPDYGYDADFAYNFSKGSFSGDVAYDSKRIAYLLNTSYSIPKFNLNSEFRNTDRNFQTMGGRGSRAGELGLLTNIFYTPSDNLNINSRMDVYKDRLFPNPKNPDTWNEDISLNARLQANPATALSFDYNLQNDLGKISPIRSHNAGVGINRYFEWIRRINTYLIYRFYTTRNFSAPSLDYINNRVLAGLSFNLIKDLNYFINEELGWVEAVNANETAQPRAFQTGMDWNKQVLSSPFYINLRFMYRDEENALSPFSFLSGEDYIEGYGEISYKPKPEIEAFFNTRVRNVWAENPTARKHVDVNFYSGLRYLWDTGLRWESVGAIEGCVFKDLNSDGLRQRDEPPVEGVKIWLGKDKFEVTDIFGYYKFKKIKARKAFVNIDTTTIPSGFILTVPAVQEAPIAQARTVEVDFGIVSKTEISGVIFDDIDGTKQLGPNSVGLKGIQVFLEDGNNATTDDFGRYMFKKLSLGKHRLNLDLKTVPTIYIPTVPIFVDFELSEGQSFNYNIPLKKTK
jgi:hypothetical protein